MKWNAAGTGVLLLVQESKRVYRISIFTWYDTKVLRYLFLSLMARLTDKKQTDGLYGHATKIKNEKKKVSVGCTRSIENKINYKQ